tara:strand:+ start:2571 stop:2846 length:276 start_codon:yes stop_codon:yes gene_type:complete
MKSPKAPKPTAQELAGVARQSRMLDEETEEMEKRLKAAARGKGGGTSSLLAKGGSSRSGVARGRSMIGGGSSGDSSYTPSGPRSGTPRSRR